jgi:hypothetical protein
MSKAWRITERGDRFIRVIAIAPTRGAARMMGARARSEANQCPIVDSLKVLRVHRAPEYDGHEPGGMCGESRLRGTT